MSGDLDYEKTIELINRYFGILPRNEHVPPFQPPLETPLEAPVIEEVFGPGEEILRLGFRFDGVKSQDEKYVKLIDYLLNNNQAGLIDLNLVQTQKVLKAGSFPSFMTDYGMHVFWGYPREGQSLREVKDLVLGELERIKRGEVEDWLLEAVINDFRLNEIKRNESNWRSYSFFNAFIHDLDWVDKVQEIDELASITKEELIEFTRRHYRDNYVVIYKRTGHDDSVMKIKKPELTPLNVKRDVQSGFAAKFAGIGLDILDPVFLDYDEMIETVQLAPEWSCTISGTLPTSCLI